MFSFDVIRMAAAMSAAALLTATASASCFGPNCHLAPEQTFVPDLPAESYSISRVSNKRIAGLSPDERLCPTKCPVDVYNPDGGQVLECFDICKIEQPPVYTPPPAYIPPRYSPPPQPVHVRVIHPIIYVPYPVPTPVCMPKPQAYPVCR